MLGVRSAKVKLLRDGWAPVAVSPAAAGTGSDRGGSLCAMSVGFLVGPGTGNAEDDDVDGTAIVWRGPRKNGLIKQFLRGESQKSVPSTGARAAHLTLTRAHVRADTVWGELDCLLIDTPSGTSEELTSAIQYLHGAGIDGALLVTTSLPAAVADARKHAGVCAKLNVSLFTVLWWRL